MGADRTSQHPVINIKPDYKMCFTMIHVTYTPKGRLVCFVLHTLFNYFSRRLMRISLMITPAARMTNISSTVAPRRNTSCLVDKAMAPKALSSELSGSGLSSTGITELDRLVFMHFSLGSRVLRETLKSR